MLSRFVADERDSVFVGRFFLLFHPFDRVGKFLFFKEFQRTVDSAGNEFVSVLIRNAVHHVRRDRQRVGDFRAVGERQKLLGNVIIRGLRG